MKYFPLIWSGIWRKPGRTMLIVFQISFAFLLFGVLQGMKTGVDQAIAHARADEIGVLSRVSAADRLPASHIEQIKTIPGVRLATLVDNFYATYQIPTQSFPVGVFTADKAWSWAYPNFVMTPEVLDAFVKTRTAAVVTEALATRYGWKVGDRIPVKTTVPQMNGSTDWTFDLVGTFRYDEIDAIKELMIVRYDYFDEARRDDKGTVSAMLAVVDPKRAPEIADAIDRRFANSSHETQTRSMRENAQSQMQEIGDLNFVIRAIVGAVLVALLFAISTMMMQSIRERTPELAVLKTVGFTDGEVFFLVLMEAIVVCVAAAALGLALATLIFPLAAKVLPAVSMPKIIILVGLAAAVLVALISVALPAFRAARLEVVDALADR